MTFPILVSQIVKAVEHHPISATFLWVASVLTSFIAEVKPILQILALLIGVVVAILTAMNRWQQYQIRKGERSLQKKALKGLVRRVREQFEEDLETGEDLTEKEEEIIEDLQKEFEVE